MNEVGPGETGWFNLYFGAADSEAEALQFLEEVDAEAYVLAQPGSGDPATGEPVTFIFAYGDFGRATKRYYAGGRQIAFRQGNELYYTLPDPAGLSQTVVDENGVEMGRILYDSFGGVITNSLPVTLTTPFANLPDAATGLVHVGNGRWYDPATGRPLQPNPMGGPPALPQALNRYAATAVPKLCALCVLAVNLHSTYPASRSPAASSTRPAHSPGG